MKCKRCNRENTVVKAGFALQIGGRKQRYQCRECGYKFVLESEDEKE